MIELPKFSFCRSLYQFLWGRPVFSKSGGKATVLARPQHGSYVPFIYWNRSPSSTYLAPNAHPYFFLVFSHFLGFQCITFPALPPRLIFVQQFALALDSQGTRKGFGFRETWVWKPTAYPLALELPFPVPASSPVKRTPALVPWLETWSAVALNTPLSFITSIEYSGLCWGSLGDHRVVQHPVHSLSPPSWCLSLWLLPPSPLTPSWHECPGNVKFFSSFSLCCLASEHQGTWDPTFYPKNFLLYFFK